MKTMNEQHILYASTKHIEDSLKLIWTALNELDGVIKNKFLHVAQEIDGFFCEVSISSMNNFCRYTVEQLQKNDGLCQTAYYEMLHGEWEISESYLLDLPAHGYVLFKFYERCMNKLSKGIEPDLGKIFAAERLSREFMFNFGAIIGDRGHTVEQVVKKTLKRKQAVDRKLSKWEYMLSLIEKNHANGGYDNIGGYEKFVKSIRNELKAKRKSQTDMDPCLKIHVPDEKTIGRCLRQVYRFKTGDDFILPKTLVRNIDYLFEIPDNWLEA